MFFKPEIKKLLLKELDESQRFLLQAHTNQEHWQSQVEYHVKKMSRLTASLEAIIQSDKGQGN